MEVGHGIYNSVHLESPYYSTPASTYTKLMKSSTRLYPDREPYVTQRMVNEVEGARMRREWAGMEQSLRQFQHSHAQVSKQTSRDTRIQALNIQCGNLYV